MNPSVLIFVALAVAWLAYLIPKALEHTEAAERTRAVVDFSHRLRILGRREPVAAVKPVKPEKSTVAGPTAAEPKSAEPAGASKPESAAPASPARDAEGYLDRSSYNRAARRRRNVLASLVVLVFVVAVLAVFAVVPMLVIAGPVVLLAAWLVACRLMVRRVRPVRRSVTDRAKETAPNRSAEDADTTSSITLRPPPNGIEEDGRPHVSDEAVTTGAEDVDGWDPVRVPLPTYVAKPTARRAVRTIDLDGTGVWSSGRNEADSALARSADAAKKDEPAREERRKTS